MSIPEVGFWSSSVKTDKKRPKTDQKSTQNGGIWTRCLPLRKGGLCGRNGSVDTLGGSCFSLPRRCLWGNACLSVQSFLSLFYQNHAPLFPDHDRPIITSTISPHLCRERLSAHTRRIVPRCFRLCMYIYIYIYRYTFLEILWCPSSAFFLPVFSFLQGE